MHKLLNLGEAASLTDGINLIHEDNAWLVIPSIVEHLSDEPGTLTDVLVYDGAGHHLQHNERHELGEHTAA